MHVLKSPRNYCFIIRYRLYTAILVALQLTCLHHVKFLQGGATPTPKDLNNIIVTAPNNTVDLTTGPSQNEYQQRYPAQKSHTQERHKATATPSFSDFSFEHSPIDNAGSSTTEYTYPEGRILSDRPFCEGRYKLSGTRGYIDDGAGPYPTNMQCIWIIDSGRTNATIRLRLQKFNSECNFDHLYIFDGDSIESPLIASLSGDMKDFSAVFKQYPNLGNVISNQSTSNYNQTTERNTFNGTHHSIYSNTITLSQESRQIELLTTSGKAFIYFHSDTAQSMPGFHITYSVDSCPLDCSYRGKCDYVNLTCKCNPNFYGNGCQFSICPNNCTSLDHGHCDKEIGCVCNKNYQGYDCSISQDHQLWAMTGNFQFQLPRAFHQSVVVDDLMWVIGGRTVELSNPNTGIFRRRKSAMVVSYDLRERRWTDSVIQGYTGIDHLAELTGHSVAEKGGKIFVYGGMSMNSTILGTLTIFDVKTLSISSLLNQKSVKTAEIQFLAPMAVVGHSANIIDSYMYIFLGYNPLYGYLDMVQKFGLADNTWSIVNTKGSSIEGSIGHTTSYDPVSRLVFLYGGHHSDPVRDLYSFNPDTESWTYLLPGPSARYYHTSIVLGKRLVILGGNGYKTLHQSDQCYHSSFLNYDLTCSMGQQNRLNQTSDNYQVQPNCDAKCWQSIEDVDSGSLKRYGHSLVQYQNQLILFGGFNGIILNDIRHMTIRPCERFKDELGCTKLMLGNRCRWNTFESRCEDELAEPSINNSFSSTKPSNQRMNCSLSDIKSLDSLCEGRQTCADCLGTGLGCVWCGILTQCQMGSCKPMGNEPITDLDSCYREVGSKTISKPAQENRELAKEVECKRLTNCYLCNSNAHCTWQYINCVYSGNSFIDSEQPLIGQEGGPLNQIEPLPKPMSITNNNANNTGLVSMHRFDPINRSYLDSFTNNLLSSPHYHKCHSPCQSRTSCNECTETKCIWCSTTSQCIDSSAYFAYYPMGQCMHYVATMPKCPASSCSDIESCDACLANPRCGWLNDISNTGKGKCMIGDSWGPSITRMLLEELHVSDPSNNSSHTNTTTSTTTISPQPSLPNWYYSTCPSCQCNGHSYCHPDSNTCALPCMDNTAGHQCQRCMTGYYGDAINGGSCRPCRCNGHAQSCHKDTGKCFCTTKGIVGHNCNRCDEQNRYIGDPSSNGTCYYNLTTDYHFTFNMSKPEDHFYSDINFINIPFRKDSDVEFFIHCSRLALVNITAGRSYNNRKPSHTEIGCGSFRTKFSQDKYPLGEANFTFFVHVYKFQTPFVIEIGFSQHRTIYLPQFFFTFSSAFLFFFVISGIAWKLKHEYDLYLRRQRQFIEMEQMASRPFSTIMLDVSKQAAFDEKPNCALLQEPTPISFEPCFGTNIGVMSFFVRLPGKPDLAIGSALVTLSEDTGSNPHVDEHVSKRRSSDKIAQASV